MMVRWPRFAGLLFDHLGSYRLPFLLAGVPPVVCSVLMFAVRCVPDDPVKDDAAEDGLMVKGTSPLEPPVVADKCNSNGNALKAPATPTSPASGTWLRLQGLLDEERLCVRVALLGAPRSPGRTQSYSLLA